MLHAVAVFCGLVAVRYGLYAGFVLKKQYFWPDTVEIVMKNVMVIT